MYNYFSIEVSLYNLRSHLYCVTVSYIQACWILPGININTTRYLGDVTMGGEIQSIVYNGTVTYECLPGYQFDVKGTNMSIIRCTEQGEWDSIRECVIKGKHCQLRAGS